MTSPAKELMFRDLPDWLQDILRQLSRDGFICIQRTGVALAWNFQARCKKEGTISAIDKTMEYHSLEDKILVELIATEGPRWVSYARIQEYCTTGVYQSLVRKE